MGLSFLAPLFAAGLALLAAPYLIHRIRRPERDLVRFSSLLFIPDVKQEVIERRRIEHWLLMLLRMLVLALLALAFARPYWRAMAAVDPDEAPKRHMILVDTSYSMGRGGAFEEAKRAARRIVDTVAAGEPMGVIVFAERASVAAPLRAQDDGRAGSKDAAREAINLAMLSYGATDYISALELAQQLLLAEADEAAPRRLIVHLVTDSQRVGLPDRHSGWKLAPSIELDVVAVGTVPREDLAITETHVRPAPEGAVRVLGKVRNWSDTDAEDIEVRLFAGDDEAGATTVTVKARSATQVSFELTVPDSRDFEGYLEVAPAGAPADDRRYFSYRPPRQRRVAIVAAAEPPEARSGAWFFEQALPEQAKSPWRARVTTPAALPGLLRDAAQVPDAVIVTESAGLTSGAASALIDYVEGGGQLLVVVGGREELGPLAPALEGAGITLGAAKHAQTRPSQFETISWVDFDHAIFAPFQGTRYNDFTVIRLYNHLNAQVDEPARVIARSDEDAPVMAETALGEGRVVVWPFALRLDWTNLPKTQRFVPLAFETLAYASGWEEIAGEFIVGQTLPGAALDYSAGGQCEILLPGESKQRTITAETAGDIRLERPGRFLARASGASGWTESRAVNVDAREGNPERLEPETLLARVATSSVLDEQAGVAGIVGADVDPQGYAIDKEYGRWALIAVCGLVLIECLYMSRLSARARQTGRTAQVQAAP